MVKQFRHMFSPIELRATTMRNRVYFAAHDTNFHPATSAPKDRAINYYVARAKGGVAAIIIPSHVGPRSKGEPVPADNIVNETCIPDHKKCVEAIHKHGAKVLAQLSMVGRLGLTRPFGGITISASSVRLDLAPFERDIPHEMDSEEIKQAVLDYGLAARNARAAGYDGIEIQGAGGLLIQQFLSPALNRRTDKYGGSLENRLRFALEIVDSIRTETDPDMILGFKMPGDEFVEGGMNLEEAKKLAQLLESTRQLDYLTLAAGVYTSVPTHVPPMYYPLGCFVYLASEVRKVVKNIKVNCLGRINDPAQVESIIADGHADMIGMVRALICDPEFVSKTHQGRIDEIRQCVGCEEGCYGRFRRGLPITCAYNPEAGREGEFNLETAIKKKRVMIIGGGVAGLETARVAALRGHKVSLYEKEHELGGQLRLAAKAPRRDDFEQMPRYYTFQLKLLGVNLHLATEVVLKDVITLNPDVVVLATGSMPLELDVPGARRKNVVEARDVLGGKAEVGTRVLVIAGEHGMQALSTADFLAERGRKVQVVTEYFHCGVEAPFGILQAIYTRLLARQVKFITLAKVIRIEDRGVIIRNVFTDVQNAIEGIDTVVIACGGKANDSLLRELKGKVKELYAVGDCVQPRYIPDATLDAARIARMF